MPRPMEIWRIMIKSARRETQTFQPIPVTVCYPTIFSIYIRPSNLARSSLQQDKRISSLGPSLNYKQMSVIDSPRLS